MTKEEIDTGIRDVIQELTDIKKGMHELLIETEELVNKTELDKAAKKDRK